MANRLVKPKFSWILLQNQRRHLTNKVDLAPLTNRVTAPSSEQNAEEAAEDHDDSNSAIRRNAQKKLVGLQDDYDILEPPEESNQSASLESNNRSTTGYRTFPASTTYKNVTLPLKSSKLANPFPEPVKLMPSHTVSDQEKADQMQAEFRIPKFADQKQ